LLSSLVFDEFFLDPDVFFLSRIFLGLISSFSDF
jgi:hypothetical protein